MSPLSAADNEDHVEGREGELDDREIEIEVQAMPVGVEIMAPPGMEEMTNQLQGMFSSMSGGKTSPPDA